MTRRLFLAIATMIAALGATTAAAPARADDEHLRRTFVAFLLLTTEAQSSLRGCTTPGDTCESGQATDMPLIGIGAARREIGLTANGLRAQNNVVKTFLYYMLATQAFESGSFRAYLSDMRQALTQASAASTRLGMAGWFPAAMLAAGCPQWQTTIRVGGDPCPQS